MAGESQCVEELRVDTLARRATGLFDTEGRELYEIVDVQTGEQQMLFTYLPPRTEGGR